MLIPFAVQAAGSSPAVKNNSQISRMQAQIDALSKRLQRLEKILHSRLSAQDINSPPPTPSSHAQVKLTALQEIEKLNTNWKQLHRGLSKTELRQLLGEPASTIRLERQTLWYYKYPGVGVGSVMLGGNDKVSGWQEPPFRY